MCQNSGAMREVVPVIAFHIEDILLIGCTIGSGCTFQYVPVLKTLKQLLKHEVSAEFTRITTITLVPKFMSQLDRYSEKMLRVFHKKGGAAGRKIAEIVSVVDQNDSIENRRNGILQGLTVYLNEDPSKLVHEYESENPEDTSADLEQIMMGIYVIKHPVADAAQSPEDIEGVTVLQGLKDVASAYALPFGFMYDLNLSYPPDLKYT